MAAAMDTTTCGEAKCLAATATRAGRSTPRAAESFTRAKSPAGTTNPRTWCEPSAACHEDGRANISNGSDKRGQMPALFFGYPLSLGSLLKASRAGGVEQR